MSDTYYTLIIWDNDDGVWWQDFGDYSEDVVHEEGETRTEELSYYDSTWRVIATADDQASVKAEIEKLNNLVEV